LAAALDTIHQKKGWDIPIHVDAASGGLVAPFVWPKLEWDFRQQRVHSINVSGHKYGLVYPGIGWLLWRSPDYLPRQLVFEIEYLGGKEETFTLNFSRPATGIIGQYYNFLRLGLSGYRTIIEQCFQISQLLTLALEQSGMFEVHSGSGGGGGIRNGDNYCLPVVCFSLHPQIARQLAVDEVDLQRELQRFGWIVPSYHLPRLQDNCSSRLVLRLTIRESHTEDVVDKFFADLVRVMNELRAALRPNLPAQLGGEIRQRMFHRPYAATC
jgi:glutamate decarboxylase